MARCNCTAKCSCFIEVLDGDCIDLTIGGIGTSIAPYIITADIEISAVTGNSIECLGDGLFVPDAIGGVTVRKNTDADVGTRPRLNFIEGTNITLTVVDDAGSNEVDITIASSGGGGSADETLHWMGIGL